MDSLGEAPSRPLSIKEISDKANEYQWNPSIAFKYWVRAADTIYREALNYKREGNFANAYLFYLRHSSLVLDHLGKHPEAKAPESKAALKPLLKRMPAVFDQLEELRPHVESAYEEWVKVSTAKRDVRDSKKPLSQYQRHAAKDPALSWNSTSRAKILDAGEYQDLAVDLAKKEIRRRDAARRATRQADISNEEEQRRRAAGCSDDWDASARASSTSDVRLTEEQELRNQMEATRRMLTRVGGDRHPRDETWQNQPSMKSSSSHRTTSPQSYQYPTIARSTPVQYDSVASRQPSEAYKPPPPRPSKESLPLPPPYSFDSPPPAVPEKEPMPPPYEATSYLPPVLASISEAAPAIPPKAVDAPEKKERYTFKPAAYLENGKPIRPVFLPDRLRDTFLDIATENTKKGLEMCGILCGTPVNNALFISCLLIPEQKCTSDTCETENEAAMLDFCINQDLLMVGWIHTHPTQTCFMSSRDLHTQAGYQVMMPESIAIVCAPQHTPSWGIFRLTDPPGLPHILHCSHTDTFHQHFVDNLYTDAGHPPGHVYETRRLEFTVHDLRPKR